MDKSRLPTSVSNGAERTRFEMVVLRVLGWPLVMLISVGLLAWDYSLSQRLEIVEKQLAVERQIQRELLAHEEALKKIRDLVRRRDGRDQQHASMIRFAHDSEQLVVAYPDKFLKRVVPLSPTHNRCLFYAPPGNHTLRFELLQIGEENDETIVEQFEIPVSGGTKSQVDVVLQPDIARSGQSEILLTVGQPFSKTIEIEFATSLQPFSRNMLSRFPNEAYFFAGNDLNVAEALSGEEPMFDFFVVRKPAADQEVSRQSRYLGRFVFELSGAACVSAETLALNRASFGVANKTPDIDTVFEPYQGDGRFVFRQSFIESYPELQPNFTNSIPFGASKMYRFDSN